MNKINYAESEWHILGESRNEKHRADSERTVRLWSRDRRTPTGARTGRGRWADWPLLAAESGGERVGEGAATALHTSQFIANACAAQSPIQLNLLPVLVLLTCVKHNVQQRGKAA